MTAPAAPTNITFDQKTKQVTFESADPFDTIEIRLNQCFGPVVLTQSEPSFDIEDVINDANNHVGGCALDPPPNPPIAAPLREGTTFHMWINTAFEASGGPDTFVTFQYLPYGSVPDPALQAPHTQPPDVHGNPGYINNFSTAQFPHAELEERLPS